MKGPAPSPGSDAGVPGGGRRIPLASDRDIVTARQHARELALELGFSTSEATVVATAVSELARNIVDYATEGHVTVSLVENGGGRALMVVAEDEGPGIVDLEMAMRDGYSTSGRLGLGLPGVRRLMDEFLIESEIGKGTRVTVTKWVTWTSP